MNFLRRGTSEEQIAREVRHRHPAAEASDPPEPVAPEPITRKQTAIERLDTVAKVAAVANNTANVTRIVVGAVIAIVITVASASVWSSTRASVAYVDAATDKVARADMAVHSDSRKELEQIRLQLERAVTILETQNADIKELKGDIKELRASRTMTITAPPKP